MGFVYIQCPFLLKMGKVFPRGITGKKVTELGVVHIVGSHVELPLLSGGKRHFAMVAFRVIADGLRKSFPRVQMIKASMLF